jgi:hypothetical protein
MSKNLTLVKNKGGQPLKVFNKKQIADVENYAQFLNAEQIADTMGISHVTFIEIRNRQPEVSLAYKKGKAKTVGFVISKLIKKIKEGDVTAMIFYLKTQAGWSEKAYLEVNSNVPMDLPSIIINSRARNDDANNS